MIDPRFVYLAAALSFVGAAGYIRDTLRGVTAPNRVTWGLWGLEGVLAFINEMQQHVGTAAVMTLVFGLVPLAVLVASFRNSHSIWRIGPFDIVCGALSLLGIVFWAFVHEATVALISFVIADQLAALPTLRKSWMKPSSESAWVFALGVLNAGITLLTLQHFTTAGALFPGAILVTDLMISILVAGRIGPRLRGADEAPVNVSLG
ncbi:MAG TPA: hypothetical protein VMV53_07230 [Acidimicrobiales bacterium]|nr:hypothetical protein [Acidimicrobiales bacterium]